MEEQLDPARHRDARAQRRSKSPVAGRLERGSIERWRHAARESHAGHVSIPVDLDLDGNVSARAVGIAGRWVRRLLLFKHGRRLERRGGRVLSPSDGLEGKQERNTERNRRPAGVSRKERAAMRWAMQRQQRTSLRDRGRRNARWRQQAARRREGANGQCASGSRASAEGANRGSSPGDRARRPRRWRACRSCRSASTPVNSPTVEPTATIGERSERPAARPKRRGSTRWRGSLGSAGEDERAPRAGCWSAGTPQNCGRRREPHCQSQYARLRTRSERTHHSAMVVHGRSRGLGPGERVVRDGSSRGRDVVVRQRGDVGHFAVLRTAYVAHAGLVPRRGELRESDRGDQRRGKETRADSSAQKAQCSVIAGTAKHFRPITQLRGASRPVKCAANLFHRAATNEAMIRIAIDTAAESAISGRAPR